MLMMLMRRAMLFLHLLMVWFCLQLPVENAGYDCMHWDNCTVTLTLDANITSELCPGDNVTYTCSVMPTNNSMYNVTWTVTLPGQEPIVASVDVTWLIGEDLGTGIRVMVVSDDPELESTLTLTYQNNISYDGAEVLCSYGDYNSSLDLALPSANCSEMDIANCGDPNAPVNGSLGNYTNTLEGTSVTYQCDAGFTPSTIHLSTCGSNGMWMPNPEYHNCTLVTAEVMLSQLPRNGSRDGIDCPGDVISFMCSIQSNSENLELTWVVTAPGLGSFPLRSSDVDSDTGSSAVEVSYTRGVMNVASVLSFTILRNASMNGTRVVCEFIESQQMTLLIYSSEPLTPTSFSVMESYHQMMNTTFSFSWYPPQGNGPEAIVDNYTVSVTSSSLSELLTFTVMSPPLNVTLNHNVAYSVSIVASNCAGESEIQTLPAIEIINCGDPVSPPNGFIDSLIHTRENATTLVNCSEGFIPSMPVMSTCTSNGTWYPDPQQHICTPIAVDCGNTSQPMDGFLVYHNGTLEGAVATFGCDDGFQPSTPYTSTCMESGEWVPLPSALNCTLIIVNVTLSLLSRNISREDIDCPGDTVSFLCVIESSSESLQLTWTATGPGLEPMSINVTNASAPTFNFGENVEVSLLEYIRGVRVESVLTLTLLSSGPVNGTEILCSYRESQALILSVNMSAPLTPTGFIVTEYYHDVMESTITLNWDLPQGSGPEAVVDSYAIYVQSSSTFEPFMFSMPPIKITLNHSMSYTVTLAASNCAGESNSTFLVIQIINCGAPIPPSSGYVHNLTHMREGGMVYVSCNDGFLPSMAENSTCTSDGTWSPDPQQHICTEIIRTLSLEADPRADFDCSGSVIIYTCAVTFGDELTWILTSNGENVVNITYSNLSNPVQEVTIGPGIKVVTEYRLEPMPLIQSMINLTVMPNNSLDGATLECRSGEEAQVQQISVNSSVPRMLANLDMIGRLDSPNNTTIIFDWAPPMGSGPEIVIDYYIISIYSTPLSHPMSSRVNSPPWNVTIRYNTYYNASIAAVNCVGQSEAFVILNFRFGNCGPPVIPYNVELLSHPGSDEGTNITFQCAQGFLPAMAIRATCMSNGLWDPLPQEHTCTLEQENITLSFSGSNISRANTACPGDTIVYSCLTLSNARVLTWNVTVPGQDPVTIMYNTTSEPFTSSEVSPGIEATKTRSVGALIESTLLLTFERDFYGTTIQCSSGSLASDIIEVLIVRSVPFQPTNLNITAQYDGFMDFTITLDWYQPQGGPSVDNYSIILTPLSFFPDVFPPVNVSLNYNENYTITVISENCVGQSNFSESISIVIVSCGVPMTSPYTLLDYTSNTVVGSEASIYCIEGFLPSEATSIICTEDGNWDPLPLLHECTPITANITLASEDPQAPIDCPGDFRSYNCLISTNAEELSLTWDVTFLDGETLTITHNSTFFSLDLDMEEDLGRNITSSVLEFDDGYLLSVLRFPLFTDNSMNRMTLRCSVQNLGFVMEVVEIFFAEPFTPVNLRILTRQERVSNFTATFVWEQPPGSVGPRHVVDSYYISVKSSDGSNISKRVLSQTGNLTLSYNTNYTVSVLATNCAGDSAPTSLNNIFMKCDNPQPPVFGYIQRYTLTTEGTTVLFSCNNGYTPNTLISSVCTTFGSSAEWVPTPNSLVCTPDSSFLTDSIVIGIASFSVGFVIIVIVVTIVGVTIAFFMAHARAKRIMEIYKKRETVLAEIGASLPPGHDRNRRSTAPSIKLSPMKKKNRRQSHPPDDGAVAKHHHGPLTITGKGGIKRQCRHEVGDTHKHHHRKKAGEGHRHYHHHHHRRKSDDVHKNCLAKQKVSERRRSSFPPEADTRISSSPPGYNLISSLGEYSQGGFSLKCGSADKAILTDQTAISMEPEQFVVGSPQRDVIFDEHSFKSQLSLSTPPATEGILILSDSSLSPADVLLNFQTPGKQTSKETLQTSEKQHLQGGVESSIQTSQSPLSHENVNVPEKVPKECETSATQPSSKASQAPKEVPQASKAQPTQPTAQLSKESVHTRLSEKEIGELFLKGFTVVTQASAKTESSKSLQGDTQLSKETNV